MEVKYKPTPSETDDFVEEWHPFLPSNVVTSGSKEEKNKSQVKKKKRTRTLTTTDIMVLGGRDLQLYQLSVFLVLKNRKLNMLHNPKHHEDHQIQGMC